MSLKVQSISISKNNYSLDEAQKWLAEHKYKKVADKTLSDEAKFYHFRQSRPTKTGTYVTKEIAPGIELVLHKNNVAGGGKKRSSKRSGKKSSKKSGGRSSKRSSKKSVKRSVKKSVKQPEENI